MHINWSEERNLTMLTDYYEFTTVSYTHLTLPTN